MAGNDLRQTGPFIGIGGVVVVAFLYAYVAIAFPNELHSVVMLWLAIFVLACRWFTRRPRAVVVLPVVAALLWFALLLAFG